MSSGGSRVTIPAGAKKTIQNIKEITDKHSDEDIYSVLIECSMDPNETIQKLLYLDTFHVVKRKPDRKKEIPNSRSHEDFRQGVAQGRGGRGWRGNNSSQDGGRGRNSTPQKEIRVNRSSERVPVPASDQTKITEIANEKKSLPSAVKDLSNVSNGTSSLGSESQALAGVNTLVADGSSVNKLANAFPQLSNDGKQHPDSKSKPTFASRVKAGKRPPVSYSNHKAVPTASVSNHVVVPSLNTGTSDAVSSNSRKVATQQVNAEPSITPIAESNNSQISHVPEIVDEPNPIATSLDKVTPDQSEVVAEDQLPASHSDIQLSQQNSSSEVVISDSGSAAVEATSQTSPEFNTDHESTEPHLSDVQHVIFPNHFRVPEEYKVGLTFGSFDVSSGHTTTFVDDSICENTSSEAVDTFQIVDETSKEPTLSNQSVSSTTPEVDYLDRPQSPEDIQENLAATPSEGGDSVTAAPKLDQSKQETVLPIGGPPFPVAQNVQNYYGFLPPLVGSQPIQFEKSDSQGHLPNFANGNSLAQSTTPPPTQHAGVAQSSMPLSPQQVPMFRQAYPHNYLPYAHYLSPYFMPPMLLGHGGFQQQPPSGYLPQPAASATAGKYPLPPYKPLANLGNQGHIGIPGPFTSSPAGYGLSAAVGSGGNNDNEDFAASHLKENNMYSSGQQTEGSPVWIAAPGRETPGMLANSYYNLPPHGQHVAFSPAQSGQGAFAGLYHQPMTAASTYHPLLQQSQSLAGSAEAVGHPPPPASYQQQQGAQMNWNGNSY